MWAKLADVGVYVTRIYHDCLRDRRNQYTAVCIYKVEKGNEPWTAEN